ncbi:hypothetical protein ACGF5M_02360 [Gemmatimonadota bacterium]
MLRVVVCLLLPGLYSTVESGASEAQERALPPTSAIQLGYSQVFITQLDELVSPLRYTGSSSLFRIGFERRGDSRVGISAGYVRPRLTSTISRDGRNEESGLRVEASIWYLRALRRFGENRLTLRGGGQIGVHFATWKHVYAERAEGSYFRGIGLIQAAGEMTYRFRSGRILEYRVAIPVVGLGLGTSYDGSNDVTAPKLQGPWDVRGFDQAVTLGIPLSEGICLLFDYHFSYFRYPDPMEFSVAKDRFGISLEKRVGGRG